MRAEAVAVEERRAEDIRPSERICIQLPPRTPSLAATKDPLPGWLQAGTWGTAGAAAGSLGAPGSLLDVRV